MVMKSWRLSVAMGLLLALALLPLLAACSRPAPETIPLPAPAPAAAPPRGAAGPAGVSSAGEKAGLPSTERLIVRTAYITLVVKEVASALEEVARMVEGMGGFVVSSSRQGKEETATISFRVPQDKFAEAMEKLRAMAVRVDSESTSSQDVTEEYVDLQSRLRNLEATEKQLLELMEKATKVEDVMLVFRELASVRQQIEVTRGRMQYLERTAAMSLIQVTLRPATSPQPLVKPGWNWPEVLKAALRGLASFGQGLVSLATWMAIFSPVWLPALLLVYWVRRWLNKRHRR